MFLEYFGLREQPFGVTPDPRFLYFGAAHREALASLFYGIESGCGFLALIAPPGMGKTTLLFHLLEKLRGSAQTVFLFQTQCGSREMFRHLLNDLGVDSTDQDLATMHESLNAVLLNNARKGRRVVLVIDEAQNLKDSVLETVRLLSDFETPQAKLLQIVLSGQPQLADKLSQPNLTQLRQRISVISRLHPFTRVETMVYLEYRLCKAGYAGPPLFSYAAVDLIAANSKGIPRTINNICFNALTLAYAKRLKQIDAATVLEVMADLDIDGMSSHGSNSPGFSEEALSSFDGISPSNDMTYQDFHDAVRAAWGNGAPVKTEIRPVQDYAKWAEQNIASSPVDSTFRMNVKTDGAQTTTFELDQPQDDDGPAGFHSSAIPAVSPAISNEAISAATVQAKEVHPVSRISAPAHAPAPMEMESAPNKNGVRKAAVATASQAAEDLQRPVTSNALAPSGPSKRLGKTLTKRGRDAVLATGEAVGEAWNNVFKKGAGAANRARSIRRGIAIVIVFGLTAGGLVFAGRHQEPIQPPTIVQPVAPSPNSVAQMQPPTIAPDSQISKKPSARVSSVTTGSQNKTAVVTVREGQTLGDLTLQYLGKTGPKTTREVQMSNPDLKNPDMIYVGTKILLPTPPAQAESGNSTSTEVPERAEDRR